MWAPVSIISVSLNLNLCTQMRLISRGKHEVSVSQPCFSFKTPQVKIAHQNIIVIWGEGPDQHWENKPNLRCHWSNWINISQAQEAIWEEGLLQVWYLHLMAGLQLNSEMQSSSTDTRATCAEECRTARAVDLFVNVRLRCHSLLSPSVS